MKCTIAKILGFIFLLLSVSIFVFIPSVDFLPYFDPTVSGKFIAFLFLMEVMVLIFLSGRLCVTGKLSFSILDLLLFAVLGYITFNRFLFQPVYGFSIRYYELLGLFTLYCVLRSGASKRVFYLLSLAAVVGADIQIVIGNLQLYGLLHSNNQFLKSTGSFFNSGPLAGYLAAVFPIALYMFKNGNERVFGRKVIVAFDLRIPCRVVFVFNMIGCLMIVPVLGSRACILSMFITSLIVYNKELRLLYRKMVHKKYGARLIHFVLVVLVVVATVFLVYSKKQSSNGRFLILKIASKMILERPLLGFGFDRFKPNYMEYQAQYFNRHSDKTETILADDTGYAFNDPFQFIIENGFIGFIFVATCVFFLFIRIDRRSNLSCIAAVGLFSILIFSLFSYPSAILPIKILLFFYIAILCTYSRSQLIIDFDWRRVRAKSVANYWFQLSSIIVGIFLTCWTFMQTLQLRDAFVEWEEGFKYFNEGRFSDSDRHYEYAYLNFERNGDFLTSYGKTLFLLQDYKRATVVLRRAKLYADNSTLEIALGNSERKSGDYFSAEKSYLAASYMKPNSFFNKMLLLDLYQESNQSSKAVNVAKEILNLSIKVPSPSVDAIRHQAELFLSRHSELR